MEDGFKPTLTHFTHYHTLNQRRNCGNLLSVFNDTPFFNITNLKHRIYYLLYPLFSGFLTFEVLVPFYIGTTINRILPVIALSVFLFYKYIFFFSI